MTSREVDRGEVKLFITDLQVTYMSQKVPVRFQSY